jgi:hypothetical protein
LLGQGVRLVVGMVGGVVRVPARWFNDLDILIV